MDTQLLYLSNIYNHQSINRKDFFVKLFTMLFVISLVVLVIVLLQHCDGKPGDVTVGQPNKKDLPYIACEVCERSITEIYNSVQEIRSEAFKNRVEEATIIEVIEAICDPKNVTYGIWLRKQDIISNLGEKGKYLTIIEPGGVSDCGNECATIALSCEKLYDSEFERDDLSAMMWKNKLTVNQMKDKVCSKWTNRCRTRRKYLPDSKSKDKYDRVDYPFVPKDEKELEMEKMMASMREMGLGGSMMKGSDYAGMMGGDPYGDEDEDDSYAGMGGMGGMGGFDGYGGMDQFAGAEDAGFEL